MLVIIYNNSFFKKVSKNTFLKKGNKNYYYLNNSFFDNFFLKS